MLRKIKLFLAMILLSLCACGEDSNPLADAEFKRSELLGEWNASIGGATLKWYKATLDTTATQEYDIFFDELAWDIQVDSGSYKLNVKAEKPGLGYELRETGQWLVSSLNAGKIRFSRNYSFSLSSYDTIYETFIFDTISIGLQTHKIVLSRHLPDPIWDCIATVVGEELHLTEIDTLFLGIPVDSVTLHRKQ